MTNEQMQDILKSTGALLEGHFQLTSGRHSDRYVQCAQLFVDPAAATALCAELVKKLNGLRVDYVVGPAVGGILIAYELARQLGAKVIFAEREEGKMTFRRGFTLPQGSRVLMAEDVITTGGSVREVMELAIAAGADVVGVALIMDRSAGSVSFGVPVFALLSMAVASWPPEECALCKAGTAAVKPGSRKL